MNCEYCGHDHAPDPFYCVAWLQDQITALTTDRDMAMSQLEDAEARVKRQEEELGKYKSFWDHARAVDQMQFEDYYWKRGEVKE